MIRLGTFHFICRSLCDSRSACSPRVAKTIRVERNREKIAGQSVLESMLCMIVICLVLFGLLQIFQIVNAKLLSDYSAYRSARSYSVGFRDFLIQRSARVAVIGASGKLIEPDNQDFGSPMSQFNFERLMIPDYLSGARWLEYEFWQGGNEYDPNFYSPDVAPPSTNFSAGYTETGSGTVQMNVSFSDYPYVLFDLMDKDRVWFDSAGESRDLGGSAELANHAADYLSEDD